MLRRHFLKTGLAGAALAILPFGSSYAAPQAEQPSFFPETGHNIDVRFHSFYYANGGTAIFGLPLTEGFQDQGLLVQYFERARFEDHNGDIQLALLGSELAAGRAEPEFQWLGADPGNGRRFFAESGHTLGGAFEYFWNIHNGVRVFGYPVSEELYELSSDGTNTLVQYFQRARFHLVINNSDYSVALANVGRIAIERRPELQPYLAPVPPAPPVQPSPLGILLGSASTGFAGSAADRRINIERATALFQGIVVNPGVEFSFIRGHDFSEESGFVEGYGIVNGKLDRVMGGGLCQVSTTMFRAAANAGLQITRRIPHTYVVYFYDNIPGFDATVFTPDVDFRWRNDTAGPITIQATADMNASVVTFKMYGTVPARKVSYNGPNVRNRVPPGTPIWQYDKNLPRGTRKHLVHGRPGMDVTLLRTVMASGALHRQDRFETHYKPWDDYWVFGPGVTPPKGVRVIR